MENKDSQYLVFMYPLAKYKNNCRIIREGFSIISKIEHDMVVQGKCPDIGISDLHEIRLSQYFGGVNLQEFASPLQIAEVDTIENAKIVGDITDTSRQKSQNIFTLTKTEQRNLEEAYLKFIPYCANIDNVGTLSITINQREIFQGKILTLENFC